jgi:hypothetical protein
VRGLLVLRTGPLTPSVPPWGLDSAAARRAPPERGGALRASGALREEGEDNLVKLRGLKPGKLKELSSYFGA